jgi:protein-S-isoprenylcysteine O-methyltransferase Ste14
VIGRWRVFFGFVAGFFFLVLSHAASWPRVASGLLLSFIGLAIRAWAAGYLEKGKRLAQDGPYSIIRHPLYAGSFLLALGFCIAGTGSYRTWHGAILWAVFVVLFFGVYPRRIREEESTLESHFGDSWREFVRVRQRFLPRLSPVRRDNPDSFTWARYIKNTEYNASIGWLAGAAVILIKAIKELG